MDPQLPLGLVRTIDQRLNEILAEPRFMAVLFAGFAAVGLLLATIGIYGVMSFTVALRTHEIGPRPSVLIERAC